MSKIQKIALLLLVVFSSIQSFSQVGIGTQNPNSSSILELLSTSKGFLPPRMTAVQKQAIASPATGLVIYCTDCSSGSGCLQVNDGTPSSPVWNCLNAAATPTITATCNGFFGNYIIGDALSGATYTVTLTNNSFSNSTIAFATSDLVLSGGITVASVSPASQTFNAGQSATITYNLSGTPSSLGTLTGTWTKLSLSCSKTVAITSRPPTVNCNAITITSNNFVLTNGNSYTGTITVPYTSASVGGTYPAQTLTQNGITLTRNAGTYPAASGNITYTISGTFTGASNSSLSFTLDQWAGGCTVFLFDAIRQAIINGGNASDLSNYDAAATNGVLKISLASYNAIANINGAAKKLSTDAHMATTVGNGASGFDDTHAFQSNLFNTTYFVANRYMVAFSIKSKLATLNVPNYQNFQIKFSSNASSGYFNYTNPFPSITTGDQTITYFVIKRPSNAIPNTPVMAIYNPSNNNDLIGSGTNPSVVTTRGDLNTNTLSGTISLNPFIYIQAIEVPSKQW